MHTAPRSKVFDDIYFSRKNGLDETRHVFMAGNGLPQAWAGRDHFTIAETGFGTGLNFLEAARLFRATARPGQRLDFISIEKYPLDAATIADYLSGWRDELGPELDRLCALYPDPAPGLYRLDFDDTITLMLHIDDVNNALPCLDQTIDAWFLDGFKPAINPDMWSPTVFETMARLARPGTRFATFTAAGFVKRGLRAAGFHVDKVKGFGWKRDMLTGVFP